MRRTCFLAVIVACISSASPIQSAGHRAPSVDCLKQMSCCELESLFRSSSAGAVPAGYGRGTVLCFTDAVFPKLKAKSASLAWKGKHFDCTGGIVNQWIGVKAISSCIRTEPSWLDGQPCTVIDYKPGTPIFGNARDEIRCIGDGLYLGRFYDRCPCPKHKGYFVLQFECCQ